MITAWMVLVAINCAEPRLPFREFYQRVHLVKFPGYPLEFRDHVSNRVIETLADYADYAETYRDRCK